MKPVALQLYSLREDAKSDFVGVLKTVADMGYVGVETAGLHDMSAAEVRKVLDDLGLVCCSTHGPLPTKEAIGQRVDEAGALGTDMLISGLGPKQFESAEAQKESFDALGQAVAVCADAGVKFGYHNHWWEFAEVDGVLPYEAMLQAVPGMFSQMDVYWASNFGAVDVPAVLARHAARVPVLHIKDGPLVRGEPHTAVGAGKMDIPAVIQAADENVLQWLVVELDDCATDMTQAVRESCKYLVGEGLARGR